MLLVQTNLTNTMPVERPCSETEGLGPHMDSQSPGLGPTAQGSVFILVQPGGCLHNTMTALELHTEEAASHPETSSYST